MHTFRSSSIFVCSSEVYVRWGIVVLREGERIILVVVDLGVVSAVDSTVFDMVISVGFTRQSSKLSVGRSPKDT